MQADNIFEGIFEPSLIKEILQEGRAVSLPEGTVILDHGQKVLSMPLVIKGSIKVSRVEDDGREILLYYVNPKESCAMTFTCCMQNHPSEIRAVAEEDIELISIPTHLMDEWTVKYKSWKNFVMNTMHQRFNEMLKTIDQIAFQRLDERLVTYLKEKSKVTGSSLINLSHEQIATELASSRVVISRLLKKLEQDQKVLLYRNQIKLLRDL